MHVGRHKQTDRTVDTRPTGRYSLPMKRTTPKLQDRLLDATEAVVARQGIGNLTLDAVAAEARMSKALVNASGTMVTEPESVAGRS